MITLTKVLRKLYEEARINFTNWQNPSIDKLKQEFHVEQLLKRRNFFDSEQDFLEAVENGKITKVTKEMDNRIGYRSQTGSQEDLLDLISGYRSYPEFRNEKTLQDLYDGFRNNKPMERPIVLQFPDGGMRVFAGNTRMDVAFQLGIEPEVLLVQSQHNQ